MLNRPVFLILSSTVALGCADVTVAPAPEQHPTLQAVAGPLHSASVGGPDACAAFGLKPGCDANFSMKVTQNADGSVHGFWHDQFAPNVAIPDFGGMGIHVEANCLNVIGNRAWVSGVIKNSRFADFEGVSAVTTVVDNGQTAHDPADQISYTFLFTGLDCFSAPAALGSIAPLFDAPQGQVVVK